ncbi:hypothetical protein AXFE_32620 [Acidithrix ferrooxidans]|uniref:Uncharacterized protein n=1 Tax=Acidithrix ferrooxidans TaxID=1280514 RepID=A0A0D8HDP0_9ACTN|nr:hypothetical protein AXFE_32620 [Acidithrix ferrooxidans]
MAQEGDISFELVLGLWVADHPKPKSPSGLAPTHKHFSKNPNKIAATHHQPL